LPDILSSLATAPTLVSRITTISKTIRDAEFKNLLADLNIELADIKIKLAEVVDENGRLKQRIRDIERAEGEPCPQCHTRPWELVQSRPDPTFGSLGGMRRTYKCSVCGFTEDKLA
jgi:hypothetical protein